MNRVSAIRTAEIRRGLSTLKTIAATAPLIGMSGTMLGILNSFRGGGGSYSSALISIAGGIWVALMFAALGLLVAIPAMWAHDWLTKTSNDLVRDISGTAFKIVECVWHHSEWREPCEANIGLELMSSTGTRAHPWEVAYDRYTLLPLACLVELFGYAVITLMLCSTRTDSSDTFAVGVCLLALGIIALPRVTRHKRSSAAGQDAYVAENFYHRSVERRLRARMPLKNRIAVLPDRTLVFGMPILACLLLLLFINQSRRMPKGIDVGIAPASVLEGSQTALVVQLENGSNAGLYDEVFRIQKKLVPRNELRDRLQAELAGRDHRLVLISADEDFPFQWVAEVVDLVDQLGGRPVLVVGKPSQTASNRAESWRSQRIPPQCPHHTRL